MTDEISVRAGLPPDALSVRVNDDRWVFVSRATNSVYRIGRLAPPEDADPTDVGASHRLATKLRRIGLNVLRPSTECPTSRGDLVVSQWPLVPTLQGSGWTSQLARGLGRNLTLWSTADTSGLGVLNIEDYSLGRLVSAEALDDSASHQLAADIRIRLEEVSAEWPWGELAAESGVVHGDPNIGNLVVVGGQLEFIDLDTAAKGPIGFDLAVMLYYVRRFATDYPAHEIIQAYREVQDISADRLDGLVAWKEISAHTQLLKRFRVPGAQAELRRRLEGQVHPWLNTVGAVLNCDAR